MGHILTAICLLILAFLVYQDFKHRSVSWLLLPVLFLAFFARTGIELTVKTAISFTAQNCVFIILQLFIVFLYSSFRKKSFRNFTQTSMGLGDILFFFAVTPCFSLLLYVLFTVTGLFAILLYYLFRSFFIKTDFHSYPIPLAGFLALLLIAFLLIQQFYSQLFACLENAIELYYIYPIDVSFKK